MSETIQIINESDDANDLAVACYLQMSNRPDLNLKAWRIATPSIDGGVATIDTPADFELYVTFTRDGVLYKSNVIKVDSYTAYYQATEEPEGNVTLSLSTKSAPFNQILVDVATSVQNAVNVVLTKDGSAVFPDLVTSPGQTEVMQVLPTYYLGKIHQQTEAGAEFQAVEMQTVETPIQPGQVGVLTGNIDSGYTITVSAQAG